MEHLYLFSGILVFFATTLLLSKARKQRHDWWLISWLMVVLVHLLGFYTESLSRDAFILEFSSAAVFLHGPLLWGYTCTLIKENFRFAWQSLWHFVPFLLHLALVLPSVLQGTLAPLSHSARTLLMMLKLGSVGTYMIIILYQLKQYSQKLPHLFSYPDQLQLTWLRGVVGSILLVWFIGILSQILLHTGYTALLLGQEDVWVNIVAACLVIVVTYFGFRQTLVFTGYPLLSGLPLEPSTDTDPTSLPDPQIPSAISEKYQKSGLSPEVGEAYWQQVQAYMQTQKPYQNPELTLSQLASEIAIHPNHLSQVINGHAQLNFSDYVNRYRVEEVKERILSNDYRQYTLLALALDAGFNSKASFNRAFKKFTGQTPSHYIKTLVATGSPKSC